ncbi:discoidin domain-containing protein [Campylobacter volucris]|uniref:discoidin domain-containing protein n=1 Tax=Campylobacter volucris TaxID=1031542 RepID=UPI00189FEDC1|nr:discoidin domain-containing protein [Campylobacter volucris]MBF7047538.1 discoidin domain-containing protein [Campylobacter volucris]
MFFKEEDVENISLNKNAIQSSVSAWSMYDDASRACRDDLSITDFAFHTALENNPWWMIDLEEIYPIECVRIYNRKLYKDNNYLRLLKIEFSKDQETWILADKSLFEFIDDKDILDVNIGQCLDARFVRISLENYGYLHLSKIEIFKRKIKGYIIANRHDGFGMKLSSIITGMYIADLAGFKFVFGWNSGNSLVDGKNNDIDSMLNKKFNKVFGINELYVENIFSKEFIENYMLHNISIGGYNSFLLYDNIKNINNMSNRVYFENKLGYYSNTEIPRGFLAKSLPKNKLLKELSKKYQSIDFSLKFKAIIDDVNYTIKNYDLDNFISFHLRGGEVVYGDAKKEAFDWCFNRHFPYEVAIELILTKYSNDNIILVSQDKSADLKLIEYVKKINPELSIYGSYQFYKKEYTSDQIMFFDLEILARSNLIVSTGQSQFSNCALMMYGKAENISFYDLLSDEQIYNIIYKYIDVLDLHDMQKAYSYFKLYYYSKILKNTSNDILLKYIEKAYVLDKSNDLWLAIIIDCLFDNNNFCKINKLLSNVKDFDKYIEVLIPKYSSFDILFAMQDKYINFKPEQSYPYITFIAAKILIKKGFINESLKYCDFFIDKNIHRDLFLKLKNKFQNICDFNNFGPSNPKEHLSYKLGETIILHSKSFIGLLKLPFILIDIKNKHLKDRHNIAYDINIKEYCNTKQSLAYKIGSLFIQAHKNWYKGGYIKFWFDLYKIKREIEKRKK